MADGYVTEDSIKKTLAALVEEYEKEEAKKQEEEKANRAKKRSKRKREKSAESEKETEIKEESEKEEKPAEKPKYEEIEAARKLAEEVLKPKTTSSKGEEKGEDENDVLTLNEFVGREITKERSAKKDKAPEAKKRSLANKKIDVGERITEDEANALKGEGIKKTLIVHRTYVAGASNLSEIPTGSTSVEKSIALSLIREDTGEIFTPSKDRITIGKAKDNDFIVDERYVSKHHAAMYRDGKVWFMEDLGSTNGTFVNGKKILKKKVKAGDIAAFADICFRFEVM